MYAQVCGDKSVSAVGGHPHTSSPDPAFHNQPTHTYLRLVAPDKLNTHSPFVCVCGTCRVCGDTDLEPWVDTLLPAVPILLSIIGDNSAPDSRKVPLLFFGMSSLVRMATLPAVAQAVRQQGGLPKLVAALHVVPAAICQVR